MERKKKMKRHTQKLSFLIGVFALVFGAESAMARYYTGPGSGPKPKRAEMRVAAGCDAPSSSIDMEINNVRCKIFNGGDMWWDLFGGGNSRYEIPKVTPGDRSVHSSFASALWFGGTDAGGQLKTAGQTYRQRGLDFWPGPLDTVTADISAEDCAIWDKHFSVLQEDITKFRAGNPASQSILDWPGNGKTANQANYMAPFVDIDGNGRYEPSNGDYPTLDVNVPGAKPDQMIWWVYNDKGGTHTAYPNGEAIGLEIHALAFAFATSNEINNMTFYKYEVFNRAAESLEDTYFGVWTDSDLGGADDDYVGCNMALVDTDGPSGPLPPKPRSFGYTYNADNDDADGASPGYGSRPPVFGIDYFKGPLDENGNELPMTTFMFFTNQGTAGIDSDPRDAVELYRYLQGFWADGQPLTYGQTNGRGGTDVCKYAFPGLTDPDGRPLWNETATPGDRRMVQSSGPFILAPGAINSVIIGAVWARATTGDNLSSINSAIIADDKAQVLFDNDFKLANGPEPVTSVIIPGDKKITIALENTQKTERYDQLELDNEDVTPYSYKFQGYRIYQLKDGTVSAGDLDDVSRAKEVATVDLVDGVTRIINKVFDATVQNANAKIMVDGLDKGVKHIFEFTTDAFSQSFDRKFVNGKTYYFLVIPYAYSADAISTKYLPSRTSTLVISTVCGPQILDGLPTNGFSAAVPQTRTDGSGNGGVAVEISPETEAAILAGNSDVEVPYELGKGPVRILVYEPAKIQKRNYKIRFTNDMKSYYLTDANTGDTLMMSDTTYTTATTLTDNEQIAEEREFDPVTGRLLRRTPLGFAIVMDNSIGRPGEPVAIARGDNGFLGASVTFADESRPWLIGENGIADDIDGWIRPQASIDPDNIYGTILGSTWAPYKVTRPLSGTKAGASLALNPASIANANSRLDSIGSYNIVFTSDTTKWSKCVVLESGANTVAGEVTEGNQKRYGLRLKDIGYGLGRSKFPGYAINLETGERVNIFFAEASSLPNHNGTDMLWNPTSVDSFNVKGGRHYVYVTRRKYDECNAIHAILSQNSFDPAITIKLEVTKMVDWVTVPYVRSGQTLLSNDVRVKLRVAKPYDINNLTGINGGVPSFSFNDQDVILPAKADVEENKQAAMDAIKIVPNPYYAYSSYEPDRNDFRVRFTNLPPAATITIYTSNGMLVRRFKKADPIQTFVEWDLRNTNNIPIASGMYIIHVDCPGVGEKALKWMAVMRPIDFNNF
jgi:hypothetical protein